MYETKKHSRRSPRGWFSDQPVDVQSRENGHSREFGVEYHRDHVGRVLHALGFTQQKPQRRARQRDEAAIEHWRTHDWERINKRDAETKLSSHFSMKLASCSNR